MDTNSNRRNKINTLDNNTFYFLGNFFCDIWDIGFFRQAFCFWGSGSKIMNPYKILGIKETATDKEIKKAWRDLQKKNHPDTGGDKDKFHEIQQAYELLSDRSLRIGYELFDGRYDKEALTKLLDQFKKDVFNHLYDCIKGNIDIFKLLEDCYLRNIANEQEQISAANLYIKAYKKALNRIDSNLSENIIIGWIHDNIRVANNDIEVRNTMIQNQRNLIALANEFYFHKEAQEAMSTGSFFITGSTNSF